MRRRYQRGSLGQARGSWIAQWWDNGRRRKRPLGRVADMTKSEAQMELAAIGAPINGQQGYVSQRIGFQTFVDTIYIPFYTRKWKPSTLEANRQRVGSQLNQRFKNQPVKEFHREELQLLLDEKSRQGSSYSVVAHLRWDLKQIFDLAVIEGYLTRSPATLLFIPRDTKQPKRPIMTLEEAGKCILTLDLRERLIVQLAVLAGMRPGEILGLQWKHVETGYIDVRQGIYRGKLDTPKTARSIRRVAISTRIRVDIQSWRETSSSADPEAWIFPSESPDKPASRDNMWRRSIGPRFENIGLEWANFLVMRRTHSSLMNELNVDPKVVAEQLGHSLDVNLNVYTQAALKRRLEAVETFDSALKIPILMEQTEHTGSVS